MKSVTVLYFAKLRQERGLSEETLQTTAPTLLSLYEDLKSRHHLQLNPDSIRFARNDEFCNPGDTFKNGDHIALMPPVAGG